MNCNLPPFFSFKTAKDLIRLGKNNDGGYLVSKSDVDQSDVLIGLGISDDWSFENDFSKLKKIKIFAYDASVGLKYFFKRLRNSLINILVKPMKIIHWIKVILNYKSFFSDSNHQHIKQFVGFNSTCKHHCSLKTVFEKTSSENIFFKIDIEGSEYRILDTLIKNQSRINGLVIEFHDCDIHLDKIEQFIELFKLNLVHIHANNNSQIRADDQLPLVLELTFSKHAELTNTTQLPHDLDMPNKKRRPEFQLSFSG
ncbi:MAG: hypothetical protein VX835_02020 [Pseudomonadota bacterium]|nr:hypothetical protein [Pseudomonadota bacterium]